jgi:hypothetical protein
LSDPEEATAAGPVAFFHAFPAGLLRGEALLF